MRTAKAKSKHTADPRPTRTPVLIVTVATTARLTCYHTHHLLVAAVHVITMASITLGSVLAVLPSNPPVRQCGAVR